MHKQFEGIFYPKKIEYTRKGGKLPLPAAVIIPHAGYSYIEQDLKTVAGYIDSTDAKRIIFLAPLHQPVREGMKKHSFFIPSGSKLDHPALITDDAPFEEEPSVEQALAFFDQVFPFTPVYPILTRGGMNAKQMRTLSLVLDTLKEDTLFVISSNATALTKSEGAYSQLCAFKEALEKKDDLLDAMNKQILGCCGGAIINSINRILPGTWKIVSYSERDKSYTSLPEYTPRKGRMCWHLGAILEQ